MPDSETNPSDAAPEEEPLLDINGNPIPRNWNPGEAPPPPDAPAPGTAAPGAGKRPPGAVPRPPSGGARPPGMTPPPPPRPAYVPPPPPRPAAPGAPPPIGGFAPGGGDLSEEEVKYDLAGNPLPSNRPSATPGGPGGYGAMPPGGYGGPARPGSYAPGGGSYGAPGGYGQAYRTPVNGGLILGLGIAGFFCGICAPIAWVLGNNAVGAIDRGEADPAQRSSANAGRIVGMVFTILIVLGLIADVVLAVMFPALLQQRMHQPNGVPGTYGSPYHGYGSPYGGSAPYHSGPSYGTPPTYRTPPSHPNNPFGHAGP